MLDHQHFIVTCEVNKPMRSAEEANAWVKSLIKKIDMKLAVIPGFTNPTCYYCEHEGNRGLTCVAIIETSHIAMHCWDEGVPGQMQLDVYSCKKFDRNDVLAAIEQFEPTNIVTHWFDRNYSKVQG